MNPFNIIRLLDYTFYHDIINSSSLEDIIVPGSNNIWNQQRHYINATSKNFSDLYYSSYYRDTDIMPAKKDALKYTGSAPNSPASLRPSITFVE